MITTSPRRSLAIDTVNGFSPSEFCSSPHGSQARILEQVGSPLSYDDLVAYSGYAFRLQLADTLCPSATHPKSGFTCWEGSERAIGWHTFEFNLHSWQQTVFGKEALKQEIFRAIRESIDRGIPVHYGSEEDGLIIGYGLRGQRWLCLHPYHRPHDEPFWYDKAGGFMGGSWPWLIVVWQEPKPADDMPPRSTLFIEALQQAITMWESSDVYEGRYLVGEAAYAFWLNWLRAIDRGEVANHREGMPGNHWTYTSLIQNRGIAADWLVKNARILAEAARPCLLEAAQHYREVVTACTDGLNAPWEVAPGSPLVDSWLKEQRIEQGIRLQAAREADAQAIAAIKGALQLV